MSITLKKYVFSAYIFLQNQTEEKNETAEILEKRTAFRCFLWSVLNPKKAQKTSHNIEKRGLKKKRVFHERFGL